MAQRNVAARAEPNPFATDPSDELPVGLQLTWRLRLKGERLGDESMIVEQHVYAATGASGRIERMSLLCSGFWEEHVDG